jgi:hypothetical protein
MWDLLLLPITHVRKSFNWLCTFRYNVLNAHFLADWLNSKVALCLHICDCLLSVLLVRGPQAARIAAARYHKRAAVTC